VLDDILGCLSDSLRVQRWSNSVSLLADSTSSQHWRDFRNRLVGKVVGEHYTRLICFYLVELYSARRLKAQSMLYLSEEEVRQNSNLLPYCNTGNLISARLYSEFTRSFKSVVLFLKFDIWIHNLF